MEEQLLRLLETINRAEQNPEDERLFQESVGRALRLEVVDLLDAAKGLRVSLPTVNRWCMGFSAPHRVGRPAVLRWLKEKTQEKLSQ